jgi:S-adenosylmethionine:diacylglycerol 3-amino-3-carboxypropyl transferase
MNERIKELAVQARNYALDEKRIYERMHNTEQCMEEYREVYNEKFAELIVRECMSMSDELKAQYLTSRKSTMDFDEKNIYAEGEAACDILRYKMKKHLGVEE